MGNIFENIVDEIASKTPGLDTENGDYIGDDGLMICGNCNTPKQTRVNILGKIKIVPCMCECMQKAYNDDLQARKDAEERKKIMLMRRECFASKEFENYTFEKDDRKDERVSNAARNYANKWNEMEIENIGLLFYGDVGTGKTFYAGCIANALIDKGIPAYMTSFARIVNTMQGMYAGKQDYIDKITSYPLLIIDDLGAERGSDYMLEQVYSIVDARYQSGKPLIVTTNIPIDEIKEPADLKYKRIYDRILEMCHPVALKGHSRRREILKDNFAKRKQLLGL